MANEILLRVDRPVSSRYAAQNIRENCSLHFTSVFISR